MAALPLSGAPFGEAYPNAVFDDGWSALTPEAFEQAKQAVNIRDEDEYVKHFLNQQARWRGAALGTSFVCGAKKCPLTLSRR